MSMHLRARTTGSPCGWKPRLSIALFLALGLAAGMRAQETAAAGRGSAWLGPGLAVDQAEGLILRLEGGLGPWSGALGFNGGTEDRAWYLRLGLDAAYRVAYSEEPALALFLAASTLHDRRSVTIEEFVPGGPNIVREDLRESWELRPSFVVEWGRRLRPWLSLGYGFAVRNLHDGRGWETAGWGLRWAAGLRWRIGLGETSD